jgi:hypothetical protein
MHITEVFHEKIYGHVSDNFKSSIQHEWYTIKHVYSGGASHK